LLGLENAGEIEVCQLLQHREASGLDAACDAVAFPLRHLLLGQGQQKAIVAVVGPGGLFSELAVVLLEGWEP
jgi:hypothetical protein